MYSFFSYEVLIATVSLSSVLFNIFVVYFSGFTPLEQSLLVVPTLRSEFVDSWIFVVTFHHCHLRALPCCDLHRSTYLLLPLLFYAVKSNTKVSDSLRDYGPALNSLFQ